MMRPPCHPIPVPTPLPLQPGPPIPGIRRDDPLSLHIADHSDPHHVRDNLVDLGVLAKDAETGEYSVDLPEKADLVDGKVPASQLPEDQQGVTDVTVDGASVVSGGVAAIDLSGKVDKVAGKGLSTNDYTDEDKAIVGGVTAALATKANMSDVTTALAGKANTSDVTTALAAKADLVNGTVPAAQLPSFVDDVLEYANRAAFPATGEAGKIYVALDTNLTYRWGGSDYVEISQSLALGETASTAYAGDKGKANATAITALQTAVAGKQDALEFDAAPTSGSANPVTSGGVYTALATKANLADLPNLNEEHVAAPVSILPGGTGVPAITPGVLAYPVVLHSGNSSLYTVAPTWAACTDDDPDSAWRAELWVQCGAAAPSITWGDSAWEWLDGSAPDTTDATVGTVLQVALRRLPSGKIQANLYNVYEKPLEETCLCFTAETAGATVGMEAVGSAPSVSLETSTDGSAWGVYTVGTTITLSNIGDKVYFRAGSGGNSAFASDYGSSYNRFVMDNGQISASGNVNGLLDASGIPAGGLSDYCFYGLFEYCLGLTTAPTLPATTLADDCYDTMFHGCENLTTAPALTSTTLAENCYSSMFFGCTKLTTAPALPATTLAAGCYVGMFSDCANLTTAPTLPATTLADYCYLGMFSGCTKLATAPALPATTLAENCYSSMFLGCTKLTTAPALPATTLAAGCYNGMFSNCTNLADVTVSFTSFAEFFYTDSWLDGVSSTGTFHCPSDLGDNDTISRGPSACPEGWTVDPTV